MHLDEEGNKPQAITSTEFFFYNTSKRMPEIAGKRFSFIPSAEYK